MKILSYTPISFVTICVLKHPKINIHSQFSVQFIESHINRDSTQKVAFRVEQTTDGMS